MIRDRRLRRSVRPASLVFAPLLVLTAASPIAAQDHNITQSVEYIEARLRAEPLEVLDMAQARPAIAGDRSARVLIAGTEGSSGPLEVHWKPVGRGATGFNDEPRYVLAAYYFQKMFLDEPEFVTPPVVLRTMDLAEYQQLRPGARATFGNANSVLFLLAYWLQHVTNRDPWSRERFESDAQYARHFANVNILTHLIDHKDANIGNLLISVDPENPRVFSVDNDVAFSSRVSDQGDDWRRLHVNRLPAHTVERLRAITLEDLERELGVVAEFAIVDRKLVPAEPGPNLNPGRGVRTTNERVQFGLTQREIRDLHGRLERLLRDVDRGRITTF